jgi:hypothetical protein
MPGYYQSTFTYAGTSYPVGSMPMRHGISFRKSYVCAQCHVSFSRDEVRFYQGRVFGVPCGCASDITQLQQREREEVWRGDMSGPTTRQEDF